MRRAALLLSMCAAAACLPAAQPPVPSPRLVEPAPIAASNPAETTPEDLDAIHEQLSRFLEARWSSEPTAAAPYVLPADREHASTVVHLEPKPKAGVTTWKILNVEAHGDEATATVELTAPPSSFGMWVDFARLVWTTNAPPEKRAWAASQARPARAILPITYKLRREAGVWLVRMDWAATRATRISGQDTPAERRAAAQAIRDFDGSEPELLRLDAARYPMVEERYDALLEDIKRAEACYQRFDFPCAIREYQSMAAVPGAPAFVQARLAALPALQQLHADRVQRAKLTMTTKVVDGYYHVYVACGGEPITDLGVAFSYQDDDGDPELAADTHRRTSCPFDFAFRLPRDAKILNEPRVTTLEFAGESAQKLWWSTEFARAREDFETNGWSRRNPLRVIASLPRFEECTDRPDAVVELRVDVGAAGARTHELIGDASAEFRACVARAIDALPFTDVEHAGGILPLYPPH